MREVFLEASDKYIKFSHNNSKLKGMGNHIASIKGVDESGKDSLDDIVLEAISYFEDTTIT